MDYIVTEIIYDTDGEIVDLPKELTISVSNDLKTTDEKLEFISDEISSRTGFCHFGFTTIPTIQ
jgi:hypothetical protein